MSKSIFGWSYPPGVTGREPEITGDWGPCEVCCQDIDDCVCPECPICGRQGDPACYVDHGLRRTEDQKFLKEITERSWEEDARIQYEYEKRYFEESIFKD